MRARSVTAVGLACATSIAWVSEGTTYADGRGSHTVVLVSNEPELVNALGLVLAPWGMRVVAVAEPGPGATMPGSAQRGRTAARAHGAVATVWVSSSDDGFALWVYDRANDRALTRRLGSGPPFDDVTAAAIALSVKAMLQIGPLASAPSRAGPEPDERHEPTRGIDVAFALGARIGRSGELEAEPRLALSALGSVEVGWTEWAFGIAAQLGTGIGIDERAFDGRLHDIDLALVARVRLWRHGSVALRGHAGAGASYSWLRVRPADARELAATRLNPLLTTAIEADAALAARLYVGLRVGAAFLLLFQRYAVHGQPVLELSPVAVEVSLVAGLRL